MRTKSSNDANNPQSPTLQTQGSSLKHNPAKLVKTPPIPVKLEFSQDQSEKKTTNKSED